jgi:hypothetical protein
MLMSYADRHTQFEYVSFCQFVYTQSPVNESKLLVPHFVGLNNTPTYPVSACYARSTLIVHCPWRNMKYHKLDDSACISHFIHMMDHNKLPRSVKLSYLQAKNRYECEIRESLTDGNGENKNDNDNDDELDDDDEIVLKCIATLPGKSGETDSDDLFDEHVCTGLDYDWSKRHTVRKHHKMKYKNLYFIC